MRPLLRHVRSNAVAYLALFVALGGTSAAAFTIDGSQIRDHSVDPVKLNPRLIAGNVRAWAVVAPSGKVLAGAGKPRVAAESGDPGGYAIRWAVAIRRCATVVSVDRVLSPVTETAPVPGNPALPLKAGYAVAASTAGVNAETGVQTFNQAGQPTPLGFDLAVIC